MNKSPYHRHTKTCVYQSCGKAWILPCLRNKLFNLAVIQFEIWRCMPQRPILRAQGIAAVISGHRHVGFNLKLCHNTVACRLIIHQILACNENTWGAKDISTLNPITKTLPPCPTRPADGKSRQAHRSVSSTCKYRKSL